MHKDKIPVVLVILDGWGEWDIEKGNPLKVAHLPTIKKLNDNYPKLYLQASGMSVGLPWGVRGNSEVGHQTIGSGQIIFQYLPTIASSIADGSFFNNKVLKKAFEKARENNSKIHFFGLLSDGGVHSHIDHLFALLEMAGREGFSDVFVHAVTDGRDTHPQSAKTYLEMLSKKIKAEQVGKIASLSGRYYAMDRNNNWDRIEKAYQAMCSGVGQKESDVFAAIDHQYEKGITDEYLEPVVMVDESGQPVGSIKDDDVVICFNFRKDRSRQISQAFCMPLFDEFKETELAKNIIYICFAPYEQGLPADVAFFAKDISVRLGEIIANSGKRQLRIAETEKYAHVTYFFNGGVEIPFPWEERIVVPSKRVQSYAEIPEMSAPELMQKLVPAVESGNYDFILVNFANPDMVGHTGNYPAAIKAVECVDFYLNVLLNKVLEKKGHMIITADHGNVEEMLNIYSGEIDTQHSKNPVPCWYVNSSNYGSSKHKKEIEIDGMLIDLAPTILGLMGFEKHKEMLGCNLLDYM